MFRKRKNPTPGFRMPPPFHPMSGGNAALQIAGVFPYSAIVQVAKEDTEDNYVVCRGFDPRISKFIDYEEGNADKPGLSVAKPYGKRKPGTYRVAQVYQALLPLQTTNPSPADVDWRVRQNPGYAVGGKGHPEDLGEKIDELYDSNGKLINYMLIDEGISEATIVFTMLEDRTRETIGGLTIGFADVIITAKVGTAGPLAGTVDRVVFADKRWFGAVKGCEGIADYIFDPVTATAMGWPTPYFWIVKECQELSAGFAFRTLEDRAAAAPDQDVLVEVVQLTGHANADYPPNLWTRSQGGGGCDGVAGWTFTSGTWTQTTSCGSGCHSQTNPNDLNFAPPPYEGQTYSSPCVADEGGGGTSILKVRYMAGEYPRMVTGAQGWAVFDNDIEDEATNENMRYYVKESDQLPIHIKSTLPAHNCKIDFYATSATGLDAWPNSQAIPAGMFPLEIYNNHAGRLGDEWTAVWDDSLLRYRVIEIEPHLVKLMTNYQVTAQVDEYQVPTGCYVETYDEQEAYVELCKVPVTKTMDTFRLETVARITEFRLRPGSTTPDGSGEQTNCAAFLDLEYYPETARVACAVPVKVTKSITLEDDWFVIDVADDGVCIYQTKQRRIHFGNCGAEVESNVACTTDEQCESGGASG